MFAKQLLITRNCARSCASITLLPVVTWQPTAQAAQPNADMESATIRPGEGIRAGVLHGPSVEPMTRPMVAADRSTPAYDEVGHRLYYGRRVHDDESGPGSPNPSAVPISRGQYFQDQPGFFDTQGHALRAAASMLGLPDRRGIRRELRSGDDTDPMPQFLARSVRPAERAKDPRTLEARHAAALAADPRAFYRRDGDFTKYIEVVSRHRSLVAAQPTDLRVTPHERAVQRLTKAASSRAIGELRRRAAHAGAGLPGSAPSGSGDAAVDEADVRYGEEAAGAGGGHGAAADTNSDPLGQLMTVATTTGDFVTMVLPPLPRYLQPVASRPRSHGATMRSTGAGGGDAGKWAGSTVQSLRHATAAAAAVSPGRAGALHGAESASATGSFAGMPAALRDSLPLQLPGKSTHGAAGRSARSDATALVPTAGGGAATSRHESPYGFAHASATAAGRALSGAHLVGVVAGHRAAVGADLPALSPPRDSHGAALATSRSHGFAAAGGHGEGEGAGDDGLMFTTRAASAAAPPAAGAAARASQRLHESASLTTTSRAMLAVASKTATELGQGRGGRRAALGLAVDGDAEALAGGIPGTATMPASVAQLSARLLQSTPSSGEEGGDYAHARSSPSPSPSPRTARGHSHGHGHGHGAGLAVGEGVSMLPSMAAAATVASVLMGSGGAPPASVAYFATDSSLRAAARIGVSASGVLSTSRPGSSTIVGGPRALTGGLEGPRAQPFALASEDLRLVRSPTDGDAAGSSSMLQPAIDVAVPSGDAMAEKVWRQAVAARRLSIQAKGYSIHEEEAQAKARALADVTVGGRQQRYSPNRLLVSSPPRHSPSAAAAGDAFHAVPARRNPVTAAVSASLDDFDARVDTWRTALKTQPGLARTMY